MSDLRFVHIKNLSKVLILSLLLFSCTAFTASAQLVNVADDTSTPIPGAGHDYIHALSETVNPANGSVSLRIQLPTPAGRGINFPFAITYDSGKVHHFTSSETGYGGWTGDFSASTGGWGNTIPLLSYQTWNISIPGNEGASSGYYCYYASGYMFQDFSGSQHALGLAVADNNAPSGSYPTCQTLATSSKSRYGSSVVTLGGSDGFVAAYPSSDCGSSPGGSYPLCNDATPPVTITDLSGNIFTFNHQGNSLALNSAGNTDYYWPNIIEDRNGNEITISDPTGYAATVTDTLGNPVVATGVPGTGYGANVPSSYKVGGLAYNVAYTTTAANYTVPTSEVGSVGSTDEPCVMSGSVSEGSGSGQARPQTVIHSIELPNSTYYTFYYGTDNPNTAYQNPYGLLSEIDYPDGGWIRYTWKLSDTYAEVATFDAALVNGLPNGLGDPNKCNYQYKTPVVATRTIGYGVGSGAAQTQGFTYNTSWNSNNLGWAGKTTTVVTTDNITGQSAQTLYNYADCKCSPPRPPDFPYTSAAQLPVEQSIAYYDWGNTSAPILTEVKAWFDTNYINCSFNTLSTNQSAGHFYTYNYGQLSDDKEYDYGQVAASACSGQSASAPASPVPAREISTPIQGFTSPLFNVSGLGATFGKPQSKTVYDHNSSIAETDYGYDALPSGQTALFSVSATNHDDSTFSTSAISNRGNLTSITKKCLSGCTTDAATTITYDDTGQVHTIIDACNSGACSDMSGSSHTTTYDFTDSPSGGDSHGNSNAYLTKITNPLSQTIQYQYSYTTGELSQNTDENNNVTNYDYSDPLLRLTDIYAPKSAQNGGAQPHTNYAYVDGATPTVTTTSPIGGTTVATSDGLGHVIQNQTTYASGVEQTVNTTYTGLGQVQSVSNPFITTSDPSYGITSYLYDALGRKIDQCQPDNNTTPSTTCTPKSSYQSWGYSGNTVTFKDENGNQWARTSDALGRLTNVTEPGGLATVYSYDALDNLLSVSQSGTTGDTARTRSFTYDSLSRLLTASNPESGQVCYGTWSNGTVGSGTCQNGYDANGNLNTKTDARGFTTTYTYDSLNRVLSKAYNDGTLYSCFQYDAASTNGTGRLANEWTQTSSCPASGGPSKSFYTLRSISAYDSMGRITSEQQCTPANCTTASGPQLSYGYDLAGDPTTLTNSVGASGSSLTLTTGFDAAAHMQSLVSNWAVGPTCLYLLGSTWSSSCTPSASPYGYGAVGPLNWNLGSNLPVAQTYTNRLWVNSITATGQLP